MAEGKREGTRTEVEEWEEPLHPGPVGDVYPTISHKATPIAQDLPHASTDRLIRPLQGVVLQVFTRWEAVGRRPTETGKARLRERDLQRRLRRPGGVPSARCASVCRRTGVRTVAASPRRSLLFDR